MRNEEKGVRDYLNELSVNKASDEHIKASLMGFRRGYGQAIKDVLAWAKMKQKRFRKFHGNEQFKFGLDVAMEEVIYQLTEDKQ